MEKFEEERKKRAAEKSRQDVEMSE